LDKEYLEFYIITIWIVVSAIFTFIGLISFTLHTRGNILDIDMNLLYTDYLIGVIGLCSLMGICIYGMTFGLRRSI